MKIVCRSSYWPTYNVGYVWTAGCGFLPGPGRRHHYGQQVWPEIPLRVPAKG
jgi:hypothetical protein